MTPLRSSWPALPRPAITEAERLAAAKRLWLEHGIVALWPERIANDFDRQHLVNLAEQAYGKRVGR